MSRDLREDRSLANRSQLLPITLTESDVVGPGEKGQDGMRAWFDQKSYSRDHASFYQSKTSVEYLMGRDLRDGAVRPQLRAHPELEVATDFTSSPRTALKISAGRCREKDLDEEAVPAVLKPALNNGEKAGGGARLISEGLGYGSDNRLALARQRLSTEADMRRREMQWEAVTSGRPQIDFARSQARDLSRALAEVSLDRRIRYERPIFPRRY